MNPAARRLENPASRPGADRRAVSIDKCRPYLTLRSASRNAPPMLRAKSALAKPLGSERSSFERTTIWQFRRKGRLPSALQPPLQKQPSDRWESMRTGRRKSRRHATQRSPSSEMPPKALSAGNCCLNRSGHLGYSHSARWRHCTKGDGSAEPAQANWSASSASFPFDPEITSRH